MKGVDELVEDGLQAAHVIRDVSKLVKPLVLNLKEAGVEIQSPELRLKCPQETMEYAAGLRLKSGIWSGDKARLKIPRPRRFSLYSLFPYEPVEGCYQIVEDGVVLDRSLLRDRGESFRIELEYELSGEEAIGGLVYTSSPPELGSKKGQEDVQRFWLHSELKSVDFLRDLYKKVRVEESGVQVDVTLREEIKDAISPSFRHDMSMMAKLQSGDRNELARALAYKQHHRSPKLSGNLFKAMHEAEELVQPSHFRRFLDLEGPFRLTKCARGAEFTEVVLPLSLPYSMLVYSTTDLTLDDPAREGTLIYRKSAFAKRLKTALEGKPEAIRVGAQSR
jgi:hypothetical protein